MIPIGAISCDDCLSLPSKKDSELALMNSANVGAAETAEEINKVKTHIKLDTKHNQVQEALRSRPMMASMASMTEWRDALPHRVDPVSSTSSLKRSGRRLVTAT